VSETLYNIAILALLACSGLCLYRVGRGPTAPDRAMAIDILGILVVCFTVLIALKTGRDYYANVGISWAILSFIGAIALAKHMEGKSFDE
jgi:multicomponent Na+:H+ antiporter subunit F